MPDLLRDLHRHLRNGVFGYEVEGGMCSCGHFSSPLDGNETSLIAHCGDHVLSLPEKTITFGISQRCYRKRYYSVRPLPPPLGDTGTSNNLLALNKYLLWSKSKHYNTQSDVALPFLFPGVTLHGFSSALLVQGYTSTLCLYWCKSSLH